MSIIFNHDCKHADILINPTKPEGKMKIKTISVLGTGTMGHGITQLCAQAGYNVRMYGRSDASLERGMSAIRDNLENLTEEERISATDAKKIKSRISTFADMQEVAEKADFIIEALAEDLKLKQKIFQKLDLHCNTEVILATTTSGISPTEIALKMKNPQRFVVAHFWNPPQLIPLVEIVPGEKTSPETMHITEELMKLLGKKPVKMKKECPGFIANRIQYAMFREALYIVQQGWADPEDVDKSVEYSFGRRLPVTGPLKTIDLGGLDIIFRVASYLFDDLSNDMKPLELLKSKYENKKFGIKSDSGLYEWTSKNSRNLVKKRNRLLQYLIDLDKAE